MLPSTPWYIDLLLAIVCLALAFAAAHVCSKQLSRARNFASVTAWMAAVILGLNAILNYNLEVACWPWGWLGAGYVIFIMFTPFCMSPNEQ
ncbi:MAG: hypothetical protein PVI21_02200 [Candidatus Woesebacteria bacterium]